MAIPEKSKFEISGLKTHRIDHILKIIKNFEFFFTKNSKKYYFKLLEKEMCQIYGYPKDSVNYFLKLFPTWQE